MAALSDTEHAMVMAMELLRKQLGDNALGIAANTQASEDALRDRARGIADFLNRRSGGTGGAVAGDSAAAGATANPVVDELKGIRQVLDSLAGRIADELSAKGPSKFDTMGFGRDEGFGGNRTVGRGWGSAGGGAGAIDLQGRPGGGGAASAWAGDVASRGASGLLSVLSAVGMKFAAILAPAAILGAVLNSTVSGFGVLQQSVRVFASSVAPLLLPVTLALSAGMLALSDVINGEMGPALDDWADFVFSNAIPALVSFVSQIEAVVEKLKGFGEALGGGVAGENDTVRDIMRGILGAGSFGTGQKEDSASADASVKQGLRDAIQSLRQSMGPKAQFSGLAGIGQAAQLSALNSDPQEIRLLKAQLATLDRIAAAAERQRTGDRPGRAFDPEAGIEGRIRRAIVDLGDAIF